MQSAIASAAVSALLAISLAGCQKAETPTAAEAPPAQEPASSGEAQGGGAFDVTLSGAEEVPGPGDPDGTGTARITLDAAKGQVCYELTVENIETANAAHIHTGAAGAAGGVAVPLEAPAQGTAKGCATADSSVVQEIQQSPANYYVNVHNAEFPQGAVRGQLQR